MIYEVDGKVPSIAASAWLAPSADIIGDVAVGEQSSFWFHVVARGDVNSITIGARTNIQDGSILHVTRKTSPLMIGSDVTVGHSVTLHGCTLGDRILVGMGAVVLDDVVVGDDCIIAAHALLTKGKVFPSGSLIQGSPAKVMRPLTPEETQFLKQSALNYVGDIARYRASFRAVTAG